MKQSQIFPCFLLWGYSTSFNSILKRVKNCVLMHITVQFGIPKKINITISSFSLTCYAVNV